MFKSLARIISLVLISCLLTDSVSANLNPIITAENRSVVSNSKAFASQALVSRAIPFMGDLTARARKIEAVHILHALIIVNVGIYLATVNFSKAHELTLSDETLNQFGAMVHSAVLKGEYWRLVTAAFLHGSLLHLGMNMYVLFRVGSDMLKRFGIHRFVTVYIIATVTGFGASAWWSHVMSVGASAGIFGLVGALIAYGIRSHHRDGLNIRNQYILFTILNFALALLFIFLPLANLDNVAHIGGLVAGFLVALVAGTPRNTNSIREQFWRLAAWGAGAATFFSFLKLCWGYPFAQLQGMIMNHGSLVMGAGLAGVGVFMAMPKVYFTLSRVLSGEFAKVSEALFALLEEEQVPTANLPFPSAIWDQAALTQAQLFTAMSDLEPSEVGKTMDAFVATNRSGQIIGVHIQYWPAWIDDIGGNGIFFHDVIGSRYQRQGVGTSLRVFAFQQNRSKDGVAFAGSILPSNTASLKSLDKAVSQLGIEKPLIFPNSSQPEQRWHVFDLIEREHVAEHVAQNPVLQYIRGDQLSEQLRERVIKDIQQRWFGHPLVVDNSLRQLLDRLQTTKKWIHNLHLSHIRLMLSDAAVPRLEGYSELIDDQLIHVEIHSEHRSNSRILSPLRGLGISVIAAAFEELLRAGAKIGVFAPPPHLQRIISDMLGETFVTADMTPTLTPSQINRLLANHLSLSSIKYVNRAA